MVPNRQPLPVTLDFGGPLRTNQEPGPSTPQQNKEVQYVYFVFFPGKYQIILKR